MSNYSPVRGLAAAILLQAVNDYRRLQSGALKEDNTVSQNELNKFFSSEWYEDLCDICNIDSEMVKNNLNKSSL